MKEASKQKILIDGGPLFAQKSGVGQYLHRLLEALFELDRENNYYIYSFLFFGKKLKKPYRKTYKNLHYRMVRYLPSKLYNVISRRLFLPPGDIMTGINPDVAIFGNFVSLPMPLGAKKVTFIYDLSFELHKEKAHNKNSYVLLKRVPQSVAQSDIIVTISENSKREIIARYNTPQEKVKVINPAVNRSIFFPRDEAEQAVIREKYGLSSHYILYTGTLEPRKNILGILGAYHALPRDVRDKYSLVLAGGKGWKDSEITDRLAGLSDLDILVTGYIPDEDLPPLYSGASLFVFPTFYEGWGMPPLEAMACGTPVITSDNSSLPEVVGGAGMMIDAHDTEDLSRQMVRVLTDKKLASSLVQKGKEQAAKFSWEKSAKQLSEIIEDLAK